VTWRKVFSTKFKALLGRAAMGKST